jgi:hypothetical protein
LRLTTANLTVQLDAGSGMRNTPGLSKD